MHSLCRITGALILVLLATACASGSVASATPQQPSPSTRIGALPSGTFSVTATGETDPVPHGGDAADDPAIWVNPEDPSKSLVIGTDKKRGGGLAVYDLSGREVAYHDDGAMNNVDVRLDIVVAGNESNNTIAIYRISDGSLMPAEGDATTPGITIYGNCLYRSPLSDELYVFLTSRKGQIEQWQLTETGAGQFDATLVRSISLDSQTEGCVADDALEVVYFAEEKVGIWRFGAEPDAEEPGTLIDTTDGGHLAADVEGLALAAVGADDGFLFASSQGSDEYTIYTRTDNAYLATFSIDDGDDADGTSDTDGIDVTTVSLGSAFPSGLFVAQDGKNEGGAQNFKLVPLDAILP